jgi:hypothetical protein
VLDRFRGLVSQATQAFRDDFRYGEQMALQARTVLTRRETAKIRRSEPEVLAPNDV